MVGYPDPRKSEDRSSSSPEIILYRLARPATSGNPVHLVALNRRLHYRMQALIFSLDRFMVLKVSRTFLRSLLL